MKVLKIGKVQRLSKGHLLNKREKWKTSFLSLVYDERCYSGSEQSYILMIYTKDVVASPKYRMPLARVAHMLRVGASTEEYGSPTTRTVKHTKFTLEIGNTSAILALKNACGLTKLESAVGNSKKDSQAAENSSTESSPHRPDHAHVWAGIEYDQNLMIALPDLRLCQDKEDRWHDKFHKQRENGASKNKDEEQENGADRPEENQSKFQRSSNNNGSEIFWLLISDQAELEDWKRIIAEKLLEMNISPPSTEAAADGGKNGEFSQLSREAWETYWTTQHPILSSTNNKNADKL